MKYIVYTDGACSGNGKEDAIGGWAYVVLNENEEVIHEESGCIYNTTNNVCELFAPLRAATYLLPKLEDFASVKILSDSAYFINCVKQDWWKNWERNGWKTSGKKPVKNKELWEALIPFFNDIRFTFDKVAGHTGLRDWNDYVDKRAVEARKI